MEHNEVANCLAELGHPARLAIFRYLVKAGEQGAPVGRIQKQLDIPNSTLSHHIGRLVSVGLIRQQRESRTLYCIPQYGVLNNIIHFLKAECCIQEQCP